MQLHTQTCCYGQTPANTARPSLLLVPNTEHKHTAIYSRLTEQPASKLQKNHLIKLHVLKELTN